MGQPNSMPTRAIHLKETFWGFMERMANMFSVYSLGTYTLAPVKQSKFFGYVNQKAGKNFTDDPDSMFIYNYTKRECKMKPTTIIIITKQHCDSYVKLAACIYT